MRTRRSWRNQNRLWKELGGKPASPPPIVQPPRTEAEIDAMWWLPKTSRSLMKRDLKRACSGD